MVSLKNKLEHYLAEVTGLTATVMPLSVTALPYFLSRQYDLYRLEISEVTLTAVFLKEEENFKRLQFTKHMQQIPHVDMDSICIVAEVLPGYLRKRLIQAGIAFIVPDTQMFLPMLGMEARSRSRRKKPAQVAQFSPATQVVLIHWLLGRVKGPITPLELSQQLQYSTMTMTRALNELESTQIGMVKRQGRSRLILFPEHHKAVWEQALPYLRNPVISTTHTTEKSLTHGGALGAGFTALSRWSMLNPPAYPQYAVNRNTWNYLQRNGATESPIDEPGTCLLQIWQYDPKLLGLEGSVDPFSLYLSLKVDADERVDLALEEMLGRWL